jgi:nitrate/TMAO reductase-like tetraheme cytochrome c subunit
MNENQGPQEPQGTQEPEEQATPKHGQVGRLFNYANNPITLTGAVLTTLAALLISIFLTIHMVGGHQSAYTGILAFAIMPAFFVMGLMIMPVGMWFRRRKLLSAHLSEAELDAYPKLDFNDPHLRRVVLAFIFLTCLNAVIFGSASFIGVEYMESVEFCGTVCHTVMAPEYAAYQNSPHSRVRCVQCHIGPGASWFVKSKIDGMRQVIATTLNTFSRPIGSPIHNLRPAQDTCEQCHWPSKHHGDKLHVVVRHETDEANTPSYTALLLKTGGGELDQGRHGGIHWWHIYADNRIRFLPSDERRLGVNWVEMTTADGEVRTYTREGEEAPSDEEIAAEARVMDCIDCHNRPTHLFQYPDKSLDEAMGRRTDLLGLPYFKREAFKALTADYATNAEGTEAVRDAILRFYRTEYSEVFEEKEGLVQDAAEIAAAIYSRTVFPEMNTNWETHPSHIGHQEFPGCWRCHDDELQTEDGEHYIPQDCDNCHTFLFEDLAELPDFDSLSF